MPVLGPGSLSLESPLKITKALQRANNLSVLQSYSPSMEAVQPVGQFFSSDSKYDEGMPFAHIRDIDKYRASRQPWYEQAGAMVGQAVVGEVIGGTIMSIGSIFDTPEMLYNTIAKEDDDFHNFIYDIGKGISDFSREEMPIYQSGDRFGDPGWWFQNGVSVASTLSMLIPGMVAARAGKAIGTGLRLGTTATNLLETGIGAATMRHSENFREASQVYDETLQLGQLARQQGKIDKTDDEIKHIASNAAALDYNTNWANFAFDFIQLGSILKPFKDLTRNTGLLPYKLAKAEGKLPKGKLGKVAYWMAEPGKGILEQSSEGLEEVVNQVSQYEGTRKGNIDLGLIPDDGTTLGDRLGDYLTRPETVDAFIWGTIGGLMFKPMARVLGMDRTDQQLERKLGELAGRENTIKEYAKHINAVKNNEIIKDSEGRTIQDFTKATQEDKDNFVRDISKKMGFNLGINASSAGNVDLVLNWLDSAETQQKLVDAQVTSPETVKQDIQGIKDEVVRAERLYKKNFQRLYESPISETTKRRILNKAINIEYNRENNLETIKNLETEYTKLHNEDPFIQQNISNPTIENTIRQAGLGIAIATLKNDLTEAKSENNTYAVERIEKILPILEKKLENIGKVETINPKLLDFRLTQNIAQQELLKEYNNLLAEDLSNVDSKENVKKVDEEVKNDERTIQDAITRNKKSKEQDRKDERLQQEKELIDEFEATQSKEVEKKLIITKDDRQQLSDLGYTKEDIAELTPEKAQEIINSQVKKEIPEVNFEKPQKYTLNKANKDLPIAPKISPNSIDFEASAVDLTPEEIKSVKLLETRGKNDKGQLVGTVRITTNGNKQFSSEVFFSTEEKMPEFSDETLNELFDKLEVTKLQQEQESEKIVKSNIDDEYVNDTKHEDIEKSIDKLEQSLKNDNGSKSVEDGEVVYENYRIENGYNTLAHQDREYERVEEGNSVRYANKSNLLNDEAPKEILNSDKFNVGTEVTFIVDDRDDVKIYDPRKEGKEVTTWGEYKQWLRDNNKNVDITTLQEYKDNVPIRMTHEGVEYNAFLHSASWINEENIKSNVEKDRENIRLVRDGIINDGKFTTTINSRTNGVLFRTVDGKKLTLRESVGEDPNYTLGVMTSDGVRVGKGKLFNGNLINKSYTNGATALIVKVNKDNYIAIPTTRNKIGSEQLGNSIVNTVTTAINIFLDNDINHPLRMAILNSKENGTTGDDITTPKGLDNFVQNLVYSYRSGETDLDDLVKTRSIPTTSNDRYFSVKNGVIYLFDGTLTGRTISVSRGGQKFREEFFNKLSKSLPNFFMNTNVQTLGNDRRIALLNESGEVEFKNYKDLILDTTTTNIKGNQVDEVDGKPIFSYTIQPVIRFDFSKFIKQEETKVESPIDKPKPTEKDFKDMVNNFDPLESFSLGGKIITKPTNGNELLYALENDKLSNEEKFEINTVTLNAITEFLDKVGVGIDIVEDIKNESGSVVENAVAVANFIKGTVEVLNDPDKRTEAWNSLPEEAAHFWYRLLKNDSSLKKALWDAAKESPTLQKFIEEGNYDEVYSNSSSIMDVITEEVIGKLIAESIHRVQTNNANAKDYGFLKKFLDWVNSIVDWFKNKSIDPFEVAAAKILTGDISELLSIEEYQNIMNQTYVTPKYTGKTVETLVEVEENIDEWFNKLVNGTFKANSRFLKKTLDRYVKVSNSGTNLTLNPDGLLRDFYRRLDNPKEFFEEGELEQYNFKPVVPEFKSVNLILRKYKNNRISLSQDIKLDGITKRELNLINGVLSKIKEENPTLRSITGEEFVNEFLNYINIAYAQKLIFRHENAYNTYRTSNTFKDYEDVYHDKISLNFNNSYYKPNLPTSRHFDVQPTAWGNLTVFNQGTGKAVLMHEIQSDVIEYLWNLDYDIATERENIEKSIEEFKKEQLVNLTTNNTTIHVDSTSYINTVLRKNWIFREIYDLVFNNPSISRTNAINTLKSRFQEVVDLIESRNKDSMDRVELAKDSIRNFQSDIALIKNYFYDKVVKFYENSPELQEEWREAIHFMNSDGAPRLFKSDALKVFLVETFGDRSRILPEIGVPYLPRTNRSRVNPSFKYAIRTSVNRRINHLIKYEYFQYKKNLVTAYKERNAYLQASRLVKLSDEQLYQLVTKVIEKTNSAVTLFSNYKEDLVKKYKIKDESIDYKIVDLVRNLDKIKKETLDEFNDSLNIRFDPKSLLDEETNYFKPLVHYLIQQHIDKYGKYTPLYFSGYEITLLTQGNDRTASIYAGKEEIGKGNITKMGPLHAAMHSIEGISLEYVNAIEGLQGNPGGYRINLDNYHYKAPLLYSLSTPKSTKSTTERPSKYLVKELGVYHQEVITNHIFRNIVKDIIKTPDVDKNLIRNKWLSEFKEKMETMKELYTGTTDPKAQVFMDRIVTPTLNNFETISRLVNIKLLKVNNLIGDVNDDVDLEYEDSEGNERAYNDRTQYEDKIKTSAEVKRQFAVLDSDRKNFFGEYNMVDYQEVDNVVKGILAGLDPDFELMMGELEKYVEAHPWIRQLVDNLRNSPKNLQNMFATEMNMHHVEHMMVMWEEDKKFGFKTNLQVNNENAVKDQVMSNWKSNLLNSGLVDDEHRLIDVESIKKEYDEFKTSKDMSKARAWLEKLGVNISDGLWNTIMNDKYKDGKKEVNAVWFINSSYSPINHLYKKISNLGSKSLDDVDILNETSIKKLAREESKFNSDVHSTSHRSGGKTVNSYGKNKFLVDWQRYLMNQGVAGEIMKSPFHSTSLLLNAIDQKDKTGEDNPTTKNLQMAVVSLQAIKKHGTKDKENMELHNLGDDEYEMFNMGTTFSSLTDELGEGTRVIAPVFPTTSDKSTAHMYKWTATKIGLNTNATLDQASKDMIYTQCILPEIRRIKYWENVKNGGGEFRTKEFATGGHMFHMIPAMNNIQGIWNADGTINIDVESVEFRKNIDSLIDDVIDTLVHDKLDKWREYGFVTVDKDSNLQPTMINLKILDEKGVLEGVAKENYVKAAATDMVYQHLIYNANMFTGIIGDPAHIFKSKVFKSTVAKMVKDGTLTTEQSKDVAYTWSKLTPEQRVQVVGNVFDNVGKRLAGTIAPRKQGANTTSSTIRYMMSNDKTIDSKSIDQYKALLGDKEASEYSSTGMLKESTNAQEFTTMLEHLSNMENAGLLPDGFYSEISEIISREIGKGKYYYTNAIRKGLSKDNLEFFNNKLVLQVTKPVYYWNELSGKEGLVPVYVKTSAYPLLPELTVGNQMDKIRILMESKGIDRLTFGSGTKLGMPTKPINIWGSDGNVKQDFTDEEVEASTVLADRRGFGFQQEVPYEELKDAINRVSQADKNLFTNILSVEGFEYDGKSYKGNALREEYNRIYGDLYDIGYRELVHEIDAKFDEQGNVVSFNRDKVKQILMDEAIKRDYPLNDIDGLDLDEALDFIAFMPSSDKYEALLSSIVKNRVLKMKFRGKSLVLSTEEGYQQDKSKPYEELTKDEKSGIISTRSFTGELDPGHFEDKDGNRLTGEQLKKAWAEGTVIVKRPAQVLLPWKFQWYNKSTKRNEILDITKFIGEDGKIDNSKLPTELLYALGMRIPNQGHNSQSWIEIVGFLPKISGDIVVAPRDFLAQMGSDFDVDKLYSYMYNYFYSESKGTLSRFKMGNITPEEIVRAKEGTSDRRFQEFLEQFLGEEYESTIQEEIGNVERLQDRQRKFDLQNRLLDIHIAIQANPNPLVQKQIYEPLGFWKFKEMADEIANAQSVDPYFIPISDEYQKQRRISAAMGKVLVGDMANGLMFISASQGKKLQLHTGGIEPKPFYIRFGNKTSNGDLSNPFTIDTIEKLIKAAGKAKGNYKEVRNNIDDYIPNVLDYLSIEEVEFRSQIMSGLLSAAVDNQNEQILDKINLNPRTSKYTKMLVMLGFGRESAYLVRQPIIVDYFNKIKSLRSTLGGYNTNAEDQAYKYVMDKYTPADFDNKRYEDEFGMGKGLSESNMRKSILSPDNNFNYIQHAALEQLLYIESHANKLQFIQSAINTDSKGLDKSLLETISKEDAIDRIRNSNIFNVTSILDNSIWGYATEKGLKFNNKLWSNIFPYKQQGLTYMFDRIEQMVGKDEASTQTRAALRSDIWKSFKSYIYSLQQLGLYSGNIDAERNRLMMGDNNLASTINKIKKSSQWANHPFISRLDPQVKKNLPSLVFMDAKLDQAGEMLVMQSALDLYMNDRPIEGTNYTTRKLFQDLVSLAYLNGGIQGAVQYLRFLPISYLFDSGMATTIQGMVKNKSFEDTQFMDIPHEGMPYWVVPNFILNYVQHNTRGLTHLKKSTKEDPGYKAQIRIILEDNNLITNVKATKFALTDTNIKVVRIVGGSPTMVAPEFLIIPDDGRKGKVDKNVLFMYTGETTQDGYSIYYRVPNKGIFAMDEYTYSQGLAVTPSLINIYNTTNKFAKKEISFPEEIQGSTSFINQEVSETNHLDLLKIVKKGDSKSIQNILTQISLHSESPFSQVLAKEMISNMSGIKGIKFDSTTTREGVAGVYSNGTIYINLKDPVNGTLDGIGETILHEVQHAFVNDMVLKWYNDPKSVPQGVKSAIGDMIRIQSIFKSRLIAEIGQEKYDSLVDELESIKKNKKSTGRYSREDLNLVHATTDIREFFTLSLTNSDIQSRLNKIDDPENKVSSLFDRVMSVVKRMLESIGFDLNRNSLLVGAIENNIIMIRNSRPVESTSTQPDITIETLSLGIPTQQQILEQFNQVNEDGTKKKKLVNDENYKRMVKEAQRINAGQSFYKATVGTTYGEEATIRSGRQYYIIQLTPRELSMKDRYNAISDKDVMNRIRNCR